MDYKLNFSNIIKKYRKENRLTQQELANKFNYSFQTIAGWERGDRFPNIDNLIKLKELTGVSIDELLGLKTLYEKCLEYYFDKTNIEDMLFDTNGGLVRGAKIAKDELNSLFYALGQKIVFDKTNYNVDNEFELDYYNHYIETKNKDNSWYLKYLIESGELEIVNDDYVFSKALLEECVNLYDKQLNMKIEDVKSQIKIIKDHIELDEKIYSQNVIDLRTEDFNLEYEENTELKEYKDWLIILECELANLSKYKELKK